MILIKYEITSYEEGSYCYKSIRILICRFLIIDGRTHE